MNEAEEDYGLIWKVGSITLEYGVKTDELKRELDSATATFLKHMELRGLILYNHPALQFANPGWIASSPGHPLPFYGVDWEGKRKKRRAPDGKELPRIAESSLEETEGEVEYRIVGIFWTPKRATEIIVSGQGILDKELAAKNPIRFGPGDPGGGTPLAPLLNSPERRLQRGD